MIYKISKYYTTRRYPLKDTAHIPGTEGNPATKVVDIITEKSAHCEINTAKVASDENMQ